MLAILPPRHWLSLCFGFVVCIGSVKAGSDPIHTAREVDRLLGEETKQAGAGQLAPVCDDETFVRRAFLDLIGRPPGEDDVLAFCLSGNEHKRQELVKRLLADKDFGNNWGRYWRDVIIYRRTDDRAMLAATSLNDYLVEQINENKPWSETATALITAAGDVREHGEAGLIVAQGGMPEDVTSEVSRIFLGIQIQCAQCHDHPTDHWKREQFHHMAAFFPRVGVQLNPVDRTLIVTTTDFARFRRGPNNNRFFGTLEHYMPDKNDPSSQGTLMEPVNFLTEQKLPTGVKDSERRGTLAKWITDKDNAWFAKAFVNRIWSELIGEGFYEPVDDIGPDRQCSAPKTLDYLAKEFASNNYDVKWFYQTVMATDVYQREIRGRRAPESAPFVASCAQRLRAEQLFESLISVLDLRFPEPPQFMGPPNFRRDPRFAFTQVFGYDPSDPRADVAASIPQALTLMNSPQFGMAMSAQRPVLAGVLSRNKEDRPAIAELYLNTLGRSPSDKETDTCINYIRDVGNRAEAFEDILWSLVNSTEFTFRK